MSVLDKVRAKFQTPISGTSKTSISTPVRVQTSMSRDCKTSISPSAGSAGSLHTRLNAEVGPANPDVDLALSPDQEAARQAVLAQLEAHPAVGRAFVNRFCEDGTMIVTLAIRGVGTGELLIPAHRLNQGVLDDYGVLLQCFEMAP